MWKRQLRLKRLWNRGRNNGESRMKISLTVSAWRGQISLWKSLIFSLVTSPIMISLNFCSYSCNDWLMFRSMLSDPIILCAFCTPTQPESSWEKFLKVDQSFWQKIRKKVTIIVSEIWKWLISILSRLQYPLFSREQKKVGIYFLSSFMNGMQIKISEIIKSDRIFFYRCFSRTWRSRMESTSKGYGL